VEFQDYLGDIGFYKLNNTQSLHTNNVLGKINQYICYVTVKKR